MIEYTFIDAYYLQTILLEPTEIDNTLFLFTLSIQPNWKSVETNWNRVWSKVLLRGKVTGSSEEDVIHYDEHTS